MTNLTHSSAPGNDECDATGLYEYQQSTTDIADHANNLVLRFYLSLCGLFKSIYPELCSYKKRYETFLNSSYPHTKPSPEELSISGFFYKNFQDATQCYFCGHTLAEWNIEDSPLDEHKKFSPNCKHILKVMLDKGLSKSSDHNLSGLYIEARTKIEYLYSFCKDEHRPFVIGVKLGHNKDIIVYLLAKKIFLNNFTMPNFDCKELISELIELQLNLDKDEQQEICGFYDQLILCINSMGASCSNLSASGAAFSSTSFNNQIAVGSNSNAMHLNRSRSQEELERLKQENSSMIVKSLCRICESTKADVIGLPCGHIARCASCWRKETQNIDCPICAIPISESILVFRS